MLLLLLPACLPLKPAGEPPDYQPIPKCYACYAFPHPPPADRGACTCGSWALHAVGRSAGGCWLLPAGGGKRPAVRCWTCPVCVCGLLGQGALAYLTYT
jgi:hypothetical protein